MQEVFFTNNVNNETANIFFFKILFSINNFVNFNWDLRQLGQVSNHIAAAKMVKLAAILRIRPYMGFYYLSHYRATEAIVSLCECADSL